MHLVDDLLELLEARSVVHPVPARRPDRGRRRLPRRAARRRGHAWPRLVAAGRLQIGPWTVLMDEFMVSGETIVRNLQLGLGAGRGARRRRRHAASATSPTCSATSRRCRRSCASPGSSTRWCGGACPRRRPHRVLVAGARRLRRVRAEYLYGSYSNGREIPADPARLVAARPRLRGRAGAGGAARRWRAADERLRSPAAATWLGRVVAAANAMQDDYHFAITSLARVRRRAADRRPPHVVR